MNKLSLIFLLLLFSRISTIGGYDIDGTYTSIENEKISFDIFNGKPLFVEAFATWCGHCQEEHKELIKVFDNYNGSINLLSLSVASYDTLDTIEEYLIKYPSPWFIGLDSTTEFTKKFSIDSYPSLILFDSNGEFASCTVGERSYSKLSNDIDGLLVDPDQYRSDNKGSGKCEGTTLIDIIFSPLGLLSIAGIFGGIGFLIYNRKKNKL